MNQPYIPLPNNKQTVWYTNGTTQDIIKSVNRAAIEPITKAETAQLATQLMGRTLQQTCRNIYNYLRTLNYKEDEIGKQYIPTLSQVIHGRHRADCKGFALITAGILQNLGIPYYRRYARYADPETGSHDTEATHVYTIVPIGNSRDAMHGVSTDYICIDGTLPSFTEAPGALEVFDFTDNVKPGTINGVGQQPFYPGYNNTIPLYPNNMQTNQRPSLLVLELKRRYNSYASQIEGRQSMIGKWTPWKDVKNYVKNIKQYSVAENAAHALNAGNFLPAREAIKIVIGQNVFGFASILAYVAKTKPDVWSAVLDNWYYWGGDTGNFVSFVNTGKGKVPRQVAPAILNKIPIIKNIIEKANNVYYDKLAGAKLVNKKDVATSAGAAGTAGVIASTAGANPEETTATVTATEIITSILQILVNSGALDKLTEKVFVDDGKNTGTGSGTGSGGGLPPEESFLKKNAIPLGIAVLVIGGLTFL